MYHMPDVYIYFVMLSNILVLARSLKKDSAFRKAIYHQQGPLRPCGDSIFIILFCSRRIEIFEASNTQMSKEAFFHEDDYCQIEIVPIQNLLSKANEIDSVRKDQALTRDGFLDISAINITKYPISNLNIELRQFEAVLKEHSLFFYDKVYTGYSSYRTLKHNTYGLGFENYILYYEISTNIIVKTWIGYRSISDTLNGHPIKLQNALLELGLKYELILIDWTQLVVINLNNDYALNNYIEEYL